MYKTTNKFAFSALAIKLKLYWKDYIYRTNVLKFHIIQFNFRDNNVNIEKKKYTEIELAAC